MKRRVALLALLLALLVTCRDSGKTSDPRAQTPAPGHEMAMFRLEEAPYCESCSGRLHTELDGVPGISAVEVRIDDPILRVWHDESVMPKQRILELLIQCGEKASLP
jgi:hypothetical protein